MGAAREKLEALAGAGAGPRPLPLLWLGLPCPAVARIAAAAGARAAVVDREHGAIGIETAAEMVAALAARGVAAIVRVPDHGKPAIQQALDAGAAGVLVPQVESAAEAARVAARALYPPEGRRGAALGVIAASGYGREAGYQAGWNARAFVAVQIESRAGLAAAAEIAATPGIDMLFFGPYDFATDAGLDPAADRAALAAAFSEMAAAAAAAERLAGLFPWPGATPEILAARGADAVAVAADIVVLREAFARALSG